MTARTLARTWWVGAVVGIGRIRRAGHPFRAAGLTALGILASLKAALGDLDRVQRIAKVLCFVNSTPDFTDQPSVANGLSDLLVEVLGDAGRHARSAVGVVALPSNVCVEAEMVVEVSAVR